MPEAADDPQAGKTFDATTDPPSWVEVEGIDAAIKSKLSAADFGIRHFGSIVPYKVDGFSAKVRHAT